MLDAFPITRRWPAADPSIIQLYSFPTPNGVKVSAMLEETGVPYEAHLVNFRDGEQKTPEFLSLNPNGKIPAILDPEGPGGKPLGLFESGAILLYLAEKTGKLLPADEGLQHAARQWVMWQMGGPGPMFGQFGFFFKFDGAQIDDKRPLERYANETKRLLGVLDERLDGRDYMVGADYSIADVAIWPWVRTLGGFYEAGDHLGLDQFANVNRWLEACQTRRASQEAINIPPRP